jgi:hypothetical protein
MNLDAALSHSVANVLANAFAQDRAGRIDVALQDLRLARALLDSLIEETEERIGARRGELLGRLGADSEPLYSGPVDERGVGS